MFNHVTPWPIFRPFMQNIALFNKNRHYKCTGESLVCWSQYLLESKILMRLFRLPQKCSSLKAPARIFPLPIKKTTSRVLDDSIECFGFFLNVLLYDGKVNKYLGLSPVRDSSWHAGKKYTTPHGFRPLHILNWITYRELKTQLSFLCSYS